jgi:hypothetical protein
MRDVSSDAPAYSGVIVVGLVNSLGSNDAAISIDRRTIEAAAEVNHKRIA